MSDPEEYYGDVCCNCKHCSYSGFPGAFACELKPMPDAFTEPLDTCDSFVGNEHWRPLRNLNEVMEALDVCGRDDPAKCPYFDSEHWKCCSKRCRPVMNDALYYLKEYKETRTQLLEGMARLEAKEQEYIERINNIDDNKPLTWGELIKMEGKPVWLEVKYQNPDAIYKYWTIVKYFDSHEGEDLVFTGTGFYHRSLLGTGWQVYRMEREQ